MAVAEKEQQDPAEFDYGNATRPCDIVMKGGITSGVVYPHAVCALAREYRFRNVGGTSAGAIAAAATAAAEYGRDQDGFKKLARLPGWLGDGDNLQNLFQAEPETNALYRILLSSIGKRRAKPLRVAGSAMRHFPLAALIALVPGAALIVGAIAAGGAPLGLRIGAVVAGIVLAVFLVALALVLRIYRKATRAVPDNFYGICSGWRKPEQGKPDALTPWLEKKFAEYSGFTEHTLTFGDLWRGPDRTAPPGEPGDRFVQLQMMTTNLTNRRAERLPFTERGWYFDPDEMRRLFPPHVVEWMESHPPAVGTSPNRTRATRALMLPKRPLPDPEDMPVVVATRMSLSFPVLLSAVPLWSVDWQDEDNQNVQGPWTEWAAAQGDDWDGTLPEDPSGWPVPERLKPQRYLFSDGGISSNFPIHFFDSHIPRWPTFGINLRPFAPYFVKDEDDQARNVTMPATNGDGIAEWVYAESDPTPWHRLGDRRLLGFVQGIVRTMQNRVDEAQMRMPGYRDRIVHIHNDEDEGGMNLSMPSVVITALTERGAVAGDRLVKAFTAPPASTEVSWDNHRWVRLWITLAAIEEFHRDVCRGYEADPEVDGDSTYAQLLNRGDAPPTSYNMSAGLVTAAGQQVAALQAAVDQLGDNTFAAGAPRPPSEPRIVPLD